MKDIRIECGAEDWVLNRDGCAKAMFVDLPLMIRIPTTQCPYKSTTYVGVRDALEFRLCCDDTINTYFVRFPKYSGRWIRLVHKYTKVSHDGETMQIPFLRLHAFHFFNPDHYMNDLITSAATCHPNQEEEEKSLFSRTYWNLIFAEKSCLCTKILHAVWRAGLDRDVSWRIAQEAEI